MAELETVLQRFEADTAAYHRELDRMERGLRQVDRASDRAARSMRTGFLANTAIAATLRGAITGLVAAFSVREVLRFAETFTTVQNSLRAAGVAVEDLSGVTTQLFDVANRTRQPIEAIAQLYQRLTLTSGELGISQQEIIGLTETVGQALAVSGVSAQQASGALLQLSQAFGGGVVRAEEFNSILEGAPAIARAAARGIDATGGSVARLRQMVIAGEVSSREFFDGIRAGGAEIAEAFATTNITVSQALGNVRNALTEAIGGADDASGATNRLAEVIDDMADSIRQAPVREFVDGLADAAVVLQEVSANTQSWLEGLGLGLPTLQDTRREIEQLVDAIAGLVGATRAPDTTIEALAPPDVVERIRAMRREAAAPAAAPTAGGAGAGIAPAADESAEALAKMLDATQRENEQLRALTDAYAGFGATVDVVNRTIEIDNALRAAGISRIDAERSGLLGLLVANQNLTTSIDARIESERQAAQAQQALQREGAQVIAATRTEQEIYNQTLTQLRELLAAGAIDQETFNRAVVQAKDALQGTTSEIQQVSLALDLTQETSRLFATELSSGIADAAVAGKGLTETLNEIGLSLARAVIQAIIFRSVMAAIGGPAAGGSPATGIFGLFAGGGGAAAAPAAAGPTPLFPAGIIPRQHGGPASPGTAYQLHGPEIFVPRVPGQIIPNSQLGGGGVTIVDQRGANAPPIETSIDTRGIATVFVRGEVQSMLRDGSLQRGMGVRRQGIARG